MVRSPGSPVRVGVTLPQFRDEADSALATAARAEELGIDGVFCFDHLWPMGQPGRPAISLGPLLGALVASTSTLVVGSLVARIGLVPDEILVSQLTGLAVLSKGRIVAGVGTGDRLSAAENVAFGIPFEPAATRRARLAGVARDLAASGVPVWLGGASASNLELAHGLEVAVNLWEAQPERVAELAGSLPEVTWGGPIPGSAAEVADRLAALAGAGATWVVCAWPDSLEVVAEAAAAVRGTR